jgi:hypothetical protein
MRTCTYVCTCTCNVCIHVHSCVTSLVSPLRRRWSVLMPPRWAATHALPRGWCRHWTLLSCGRSFDCLLVLAHTATRYSSQYCGKVLFQSCLLLSLHLCRMRQTITTGVQEDVHNVAGTPLSRVVQHVASVSIDGLHLTPSLQQGANDVEMTAVDCEH